LRGEARYYNKSAPWLQLLDDLQAPVMDACVIDSSMFLTAVKRIHNWKSPGPDCIHGFWLKHLRSLHPVMLKFFNSFISTGGDSLPANLLTGRTTLIIKDVTKGNIPNNYRPITCLSSVWKLFSSALHHMIYRHLESNDLLAVEQKGCYRGSRGTKDQLLIDKLVLTEARKRHKNLYLDF